MGLVDLSTITGYSPGYLSRIINGRVHSERAKKVIALALGEDVSSLWERKDSDYYFKS